MSKKGQNIPEGQPQETIGSGLSDGVVDQLIAREKLISTTNKTNEQLLFFHGNGAWARIVSSVNTLKEEEVEGLVTGEKTIKETIGDSTLAKLNVIMGGTLEQGTPNSPTSLKGGVNESLHNPINIDLDGYITAGDTNNNAYNKYESLGFRPTPGIKQVSVKSKGTYGTIREAEVSVSVWTLEDLEMLQALYLRPGYTVLLEWGHSLQLNSNDGSVTKDIQYYRKFLEDKIEAKTIEQDLKEIAEDSDYNYDSMFGYVSNFSWSLNSDGGYDCTLKIISKGTILESIAVTFDPSEVYPADQMDKWNEDSGKKERRSIYHKLFTEMDKLVGDPYEHKPGQISLADAYLSLTPAAALYQITTGEETSAERVANTLFGVSGSTLADGENLAIDRVQDVQSLTGRQLAADPTFNAKIDKLINGGSFNYKGTEYTWTAEDPFASLEEEPAIQYLKNEFEEYGLEFVESGVYDNVFIRVKRNPSIFQEFPLDEKGATTERAQSFARINTYNIVDFITENGILPGN